MNFNELTINCSLASSLSIFPNFSKMVLIISVACFNTMWRSDLDISELKVDSKVERCETRGIRELSRDLGLDGKRGITWDFS